MDRIEIIEMFVSLGRKLSEGLPPEVVAEAIEANGWFSSGDTEHAVDAICSEMLDRTKLAAWLSKYPLLPVAEPADVAIVMAGNIPLVGFYDLLCTLCAGHTAYIKPSSKDTVLMNFVVSLTGCDRVRRLESDTSVDAALVTGGTDALLYYGSHWRGVPLLTRSHRSSVAVLDGSENDDRLRFLADDCFRYNGLGCRNVSLIMVPADYDIGRLAASLSRYTGFGWRYADACRSRRALLTMQNERFVDGGNFVLVEGEALSENIAQIEILRYRNLSEASDWLSRHDGELQCVVTESLCHPRRVDFGQAQRPTLDDVPDGMDPMLFLAQIERK